MPTCPGWQWTLADGRVSVKELRLPSVMAVLKSDSTSALLLAVLQRVSETVCPCHFVCVRAHACVSALVSVAVLT